MDSLYFAMDPAGRRYLSFLLAPIGIYLGPNKQKLSILSTTMRILLSIMFIVSPLLLTFGFPGVPKCPCYAISFLQNMGMLFVFQGLHNLCRSEEPIDLMASNSDSNVIKKHSINSVPAELVSIIDDGNTTLDYSSTEHSKLLQLRLFHRVRIFFWMCMFFSPAIGLSFTIRASDEPEKGEDQGRFLFGLPIFLGVWIIGAFLSVLALVTDVLCARIKGILGGWKRIEEVVMMEEDTRRSLMQLSSGEKQKNDSDNTASKNYATGTDPTINTLNETNETSVALTSSDTVRPPDIGILLSRLSQRETHLKLLVRHCNKQLAFFQSMFLSIVNLALFFTLIYVFSLQQKHNNWKPGLRPAYGGQGDDLPTDGSIPLSEVELYHNRKEIKQKINVMMLYWWIFIIMITLHLVSCARPIETFKKGILRLHSIRQMRVSSKIFSFSENSDASGIDLSTEGGDPFAINNHLNLIMEGSGWRIFAITVSYSFLHQVGGTVVVATMCTVLPLVMD